MTPPDDIRDLPPASEGETSPAPGKPAQPLREIGPESEVRGGPEAPDDDIVKPQPRR